MALVQYSDSESDAEQEAPPRKINKIQDPPSHHRPIASLPPLPASFHDLYASSTRVSVRDDPSLHGGRKRVIPHVEGNWPTHIYLEWYPSKEELGILGNIITQAEHMLRGEQAKLHSLLHSDLGAQLPLHISLSRPVVLRTEEREPFMDSFQGALQNSEISAFDVQLENLDWVSNSEKTRWFYVLRARRPDKDDLNRLLRLSNGSLGYFGQPALYKPASPASKLDEPQRRTQDSEHSPNDLTECFHVSIAWSLAHPSLEDTERMESINLQGLNDLRVHFDCVKAKIGNNVSSIPLPR
ncbi:U6 snRNA phosphodiesterase Usb1 [Aspergillus cavernicola]|uniref:U6 snRNA phosphodiesterase n=1 Tax=Aspergillus cavernicola TaxID=176166 RepID=A0ABR4IVL0_9EURO